MSAKTDPVVRALEAALQTGDSIDVRCALGERLLALSENGQALEQFEAGLLLEPASQKALAGAIRAAELSGDLARASAYRVAAQASKPPPAKTTATADEGPVMHVVPAPTASKPPPIAIAPDGATRSPPSHSPSSPGSHSAPPHHSQPPPAPPSHAQSRADDPPGTRPALRVVSDDDDAIESTPAVTFADIGGMDEVKQRLTRSFLLPLRNPELVRRFGKSTGGGLLLYGPPGCGKTFLARAVAGEVGARFLNIGLSDVLDLWLGESERKLHELFEQARRHQPTLIFLDEVDALGQRRSNLKGSAGRTLANQLLSEMDGMAGNNAGVFFLAATNHPWDVDAALRRPGRFDRLVFVSPPDEPARRAIFQLKLALRPCASDVDAAALAKASPGFSGADIDGVVRNATEFALEESVASGHEVDVDQALLKKALRDTRPSTRAWFELARNHAIYANEGGTYDDLLAHLKTLGLA